MPSQENIGAGLAGTPTPPTESSSIPSAEEPQTVRELTQTDHLNRRLLKSLLDFMQTSSNGLDVSNEDDADSCNNDFEE